MPASARLRRSIARVEAHRAARGTCRGRTRTRGRRSPASLRRARSLSSASASWSSASAATCSRARRRSSRSTGRGQRRLRAGRTRRSARRSRPSSGRASSSASTARPCFAGSRRSRRSSARATTAPSRTRSASASCPERPVAVLRRGPESWLVSARGRVDRAAPVAGRPRLPRIWVSRGRGRTGAMLTRTRVRPRPPALAGAGGALPLRASPRSPLDNGVARLPPALGPRALLGTPTDVPLKLAVARRVLAMLPAGSTYLDVSVPGRPVSGTGSPDASTQLKL